MKNEITKFDFNAAFKALDEINIPQTSGLKARRDNLNESVQALPKTDCLLEDFYNVGSTDELNQAATDREEEIKAAKLDRIEKIIDLDAKSPEELQPSYVGKTIIQCPQCMTMFYKDQADVVASEEDPTIVNVAEVCQHCGNDTGYTVIGKVGAPDAKEHAPEQPVEETPTEEVPVEGEELPEVPTEKAPAEEAPVEETPTEEAPVETEEAPVEEAPVEEEEKKEESFTSHSGKSLTEQIADALVEDYKAGEFVNTVYDLAGNEYKIPDGYIGIVSEVGLMHTEPNSWPDVAVIKKEDLEEFKRCEKLANDMYEEVCRRYAADGKEPWSTNSELTDAEIKRYNLTDVLGYDLSNADNSIAYFMWDVIGCKADVYGEDDDIWSGDALVEDYEAGLEESVNLNKEFHDINKKNASENDSENLTLNEDATIEEGLFSGIKLRKEAKDWIEKKQKGLRSRIINVRNYGDYEKLWNEIVKDSTIDQFQADDKAWNMVTDWQEEMTNLLTKYGRLNKVTESLNEDVDLDKKLKEHNEYIKVLQDEIAKEEKEIANAKNEFIKKMHESNLESLKAALDKAIPEEVKAETQAEELPEPGDVEVDSENTEEAPTEETKTESLNRSEINKPVEKKHLAEFDSKNLTLNEGIKDKLSNLFTKIVAYIDCSGSNGFGYRIGKQIEKAKKLGATEFYYFSNIISSDIDTIKANGNGSGNYNAVLDHINKHNFKKVLVLTDDDINWSNNGFGGLTLKNDPRVTVIDIKGLFDESLINKNAEEYVDHLTTENRTINEASVESELARFAASLDEGGCKECNEGVEEIAKLNEFEDEVMNEAVEENACSLDVPEANRTSFRQMINSPIFKKFGGSVEESMEEELPASVLAARDHAMQKIQDVIDAEEEKNEDTPIELEEIEDNRINEVFSNYLTNVYDNVSNFKLTECTIKDKKLILEGIINFNSGNSKATTFEFNRQSLNHGKAIYEGINKDLAADSKFLLEGVHEDGGKNLFIEELNYSYHIGKSLVEGYSHLNEGVFDKIKQGAAKVGQKIGDAFTNVAKNLDSMFPEGYLIQSFDKSTKTKMTGSDYAKTISTFKEAEKLAKDFSRKNGVGFVRLYANKTKLSQGDEADIICAYVNGERAKDKYNKIDTLARDAKLNRKDAGKGDEVSEPAADTSAENKPVDQPKPVENNNTTTETNNVEQKPVDNNVEAPKAEQGTEQKPAAEPKAEAPRNTAAVKSTAEYNKILKALKATGIDTSKLLNGKKVTPEFKALRAALFGTETK